MKIALQLFTVRDAAQEHLTDTLLRVRDSGFTHVQWSGMPEMPGDAIREALSGAGLTAMAGHTSVEAFEADYDGMLRHWQAVGVPHLATGSMMPECRDRYADWLQGAARLDTLGARLAQDGITWSYHNHDFELACFPDVWEAKLDLLYQYTSLLHVKAELDVAWLALGGVAPQTYLQRYAGRCPVIHLKDALLNRHEGDAPVFTALGDGDLQWDDIMQAVACAGVEWCVYEQDTTRGDIWEDVQRSRAFLEQYVNE